MMLQDLFLLARMSVAFPLFGWLMWQATMSVRRVIRAATLKAPSNDIGVVVILSILSITTIGAYLLVLVIEPAGMR